MQAYTAMMSDPNAATRATADPVLRALRRTRQVRQFTDEPVTETDLNAILEVARWSGSSMKPSAMDVHRHPRSGRPGPVGRTRSQRQARRRGRVAIAIAMRGDNPEWDAYDEGRAAERILVAAGALGLGAAIGWAPEASRPQVAAFLGLTAPAFVRTIISLGHPTEAAQQPRSAPGTARRPIAELVRER